jgi:hypothetical protein
MKKSLGKMIYIINFRESQNFSFERYFLFFDQASTSLLQSYLFQKHRSLWI